MPISSQRPLTFREISVVGGVDLLINLSNERLLGSGVSLRKTTKLRFAVCSTFDKPHFASEAYEAVGVLNRCARPAMDELSCDGETAAVEAINGRASKIPTPEYSHLNATAQALACLPLTALLLWHQQKSARHLGVGGDESFGALDFMSGLAARRIHFRLELLQETPFDPTVRVSEELAEYSKGDMPGVFDVKTDGLSLSARDAIDRLIRTAAWRRRIDLNRGLPPPSALQLDMISKAKSFSYLSSEHLVELVEYEDIILNGAATDLALLELWRRLSIGAYDAIECARMCLESDDKYGRKDQLRLGEPRLLVRLAREAKESFSTRGRIARDLRWKEAVHELDSIYRQSVATTKKTLKNYSGKPTGNGLKFVEHVGLLYQIPLRTAVPGAIRK